MSDHDKFCAREYPGNEAYPCECFVIAKIRKDERDQAALRVSLAWASFEPDCGSEVHMRYDDAIAAARGDGEQA